MRPEAPAVESPTVRPRRPGSRQQPDRKARLRRVALEGLEPRTLMATLPAPLVTGQFNASPGGARNEANSNESAPVIAVDPTNPNNLVAVYTRNDPSLQLNNNQTNVIVDVSLSTDAGRTWGRLALPNVLLDPEQDQTNAPAKFYSHATDGSVAFDRNGEFYVVTSQHNNDNSSGAIVLNKYNFAAALAGGSPLIANKVLYRWGQDQAAHPIVVVDNNVSSFADPAGPVQADRFAGNPATNASGNVYVAWDTVDANPTGLNNFNPNTIKLVVSSDGGNQFGAVRTVSDGGNQTTERNTMPRLAVSQGRLPGTLSPTDPGIPGGQVTLVWDEFAGLNNTPVPRDAIKVDRVAGGLGRQASYGTQANSTVINDAVAPASGNHIPTVTLFDLPVDFPNSAKFTDADVITDLDVTLSLNHSAINELRIRLIPPPGSGLGPILLVDNRTDAAGTSTNNVGVSGANLGGPLAGGPFVPGTFPGTIFDAESQRSIVNNGGGAASVGRFRPEGFGATLASVYGLTRLQLTGTWQLEITDFRATGGNPLPPRQLREFTLSFTAGLVPGNDVTLPTGSGLGDVTTLVRGAQVPTGTGGFPNAGAQAVSPTGYGPAPVIASDNTLGVFSPFQGRLYVAYAGRRADTAADNSDIFLMVSDDGGLTWQAPAGTSRRVNDDLATQDGFSEGGGNVRGTTGRPQFQPNIAVDPTTGTAVVSYLDARHDAARARVATTLATTIDGGATFGPQTFVNAPNVAFDQVERQAVVLGPIPENQSAGNGQRDTTFGFGDRGGLAVLGGQVYTAWAGNLNGGDVGNFRLDVRVAPATIAAGPRVVDSTMGPVAALTTPVVLPGGGLGVRTINATPAADGTQQADGFIVTFDRPVDPATFDAADVVARYLTTAGTPGATIPIVEILPIPTDAFDPSFPDAVYGRNNRFGFTKFLVRFAAQAGVGTYSYAVGPDIRDRIRGGPIVPREVFTSTNVPLRIPPGVGSTTGTTVSSLTVSGIPASQLIADVNVNLTLTHTFDGDLVITLIAPNGARIPLSIQNGGSGDNYTATTFDDQALTAIDAGTPPFTGAFRPDGVLGALGGLSPNGLWQLEIADVASGDSGLLQAWSLDFQLAGVAPQPVPGNRMDQDASGRSGQADVDAYATPRPVSGVPFQAVFDPGTLPLIVPGPHVVATNAVGPGGAILAPTAGENLARDTTVSAVDVRFDRDILVSTFTVADVLRILGPAGELPLRDSTGTPTIAVSAIGASGTPPGARLFRISFPTQQLNGTYTVLLGADIRSRAGDPIDANRNAGVDTLRGVASSGATPVTIPSVDVPQPLLPQRTATSIISVADDFVIQDVTLALNISFPNDPDLTATLVAPDGTRVLLFSGVGGSGTRRDFGTATADTVFDDSAATPIQNGEPPFFGRFRPQVGPTGASLASLRGRSSAGIWQLEIANAATTPSGTLNRWSLTFLRPVSGTGTGEPVADRTTASFRIFTTAPANPLSSTTWSSVGPASINGNGNSGRIGGIAVDPSDPSGNTVFIGGASGGIWKTTNFLTTDPRGPVYVPLTDFGPTLAINIGGIAVFGRNNDPNQSIVFAATGEGDTGSPGVGVLRSTDGGSTWTLLDSSVNVDAAGNPTPLSDPRRDHIFVGATSFRVLVDPRPTVSGDVIVYVAMSGAANRAGVWRSLDSGRTWQRMRAGQATDLVFDPASGVINAFTNPTGNLLTLYAGFRGEGVFGTPNQGQIWNPLLGLPPGHPLIQDAGPPAVPPGTPVPVDAPDRTPTGNKGRIVLAKPRLTGDPARNALYQGWLYAVVVTGDSRLDGLYLTKDANRAQGQNWTRVRLGNRAAPPGPGGPQGAVPSNDANLPDYDPLGNALFAQGNYDVALEIDPTNPNVVYLGGTRDGNVTGLLRVDTTGISDPYAFFLANDRNDGGRLRANTDDPVALSQPGTGPSASFPDPRTTPTLNLLTDPNNPTNPNATFLISNTARFNNSGVDARWIPFDIEGTDQHRFVTTVDPLTGRTRLIIGDDQGVFSALDNEGQFDLLTGTRPRFYGGIGSAVAPEFSRNGNLQITQFYYGASQPSSVAAQAAGALFYGQAQDNGSPVSDPNLLANGNIVWSGPEGDGTGVATDQTGTGTSYRYNWPCCGGNITDFFRVKLPGQVEVGRTTGLVGNDPAGNVPDRQWPFLGGFNFAVNPIVPAFSLNPATGQRIETGQIVISSALGRVFRTLDNGLTWQLIGDPVANPGVLDGSNAQALAFGAPAPSPAAPTADFIYAGTRNGNIFVTFTGGGGGAAGNQWVPLSGGLDGSPVQAIVTNPSRGSREAYAVTRSRVYHMADAAAPNAMWRNITANLFGVMHNSFGNPVLAEAQARYLTSLAVDWRYVLPDGATPPGGPTADPAVTHPVLYVAGEGGVYRSTNDGGTWALFPAVDPQSLNTTPTPPGTGGGLPNAQVTDLDLALGNINPTTGRPDVSTGPNVLLATTYGRGSFAIRLAPIVFPNTPTQPGLLALDPATDTGFPPPNAGAASTDRVTADATPIVVGLSEQSAFGNLVRITLLDLTDPANPVYIGGYDPANPATDVVANQTGPTGQFRVQVTQALPDGVRVIGAQATNLSGTRGNIALLTVVIDTQPPAAPAAPDLQAASDSGFSNADNLTNFNNAAPANAPVFDVVVPASLPPGESVVTVQLFRSAAPGGVGGPILPPVLVNTLTNRGPGVVSIADINQPDPAQQAPGGPIPDGLYFYSARLVDQAGNVGPLGPQVAVTIETGAPTVGAPDLTPETDAGRPRPPRDADNLTNVTTPSFQGVVEPNALIELFVGGVAAGSTRAEATGAYLITTTVPLAEGANTVTVRETDIFGNRGPMSPPLVVTLDTAPPAPIAPDLAAPADSGPSNADNVTNVNTPTFVGTAEPLALVQIFAQLVAADGQPDNPIVLAGEAVADAAGGYSVTVGQYVQPAPATTIAALGDGRYNITALQIDVAGNVSRTQVFGNSGAVVIDGTDANDHGGRDPQTGANLEGWFYMQQVLENIQPNVSNGNRVLVSVGADPTGLTPNSPLGAAAAIASAFAQSPLPGLGWTIAFVEGPADIEAYLSGQVANARDRNGQVIAGGIRLAQTGILYLTTAGNASGDLSSFGVAPFTSGELGVVNSHGIDIANFVNSGGGLFAQAESPFSFGGRVVRPFGWLSSIFPNISVGNPTTTGPNAIVITPVGMAAFPGLTVADLSLGPWHNTFGGLPGPDGVVGTVDDDFTPLGVAVTDLNALPTNPAARRINLVLTSAGGRPATALMVTVDTQPDVPPGPPDLQAASDTGASNTDNLTSANNATATNAPVFDVVIPAFPAGETFAAAVQLFRAPVVGGVVGAPALVNTLANQPSGTVAMADINKSDPTQQVPGPAIPDGQYVYTYRVVDQAGNVGLMSPGLAVTIRRGVIGLDLVDASDTFFNVTDPAGVHVVGSNADNYTSDSTPTFAASNIEPGSTVRLIRDGVVVLTQVVPGGAGGPVTVSLTDPGPVAGGPHTYSVQQLDQTLNNISGFSNDVGVTVDVIVPAVPSAPRLLPGLPPAGDDSGVQGDNLTNVPRPRLTGAVALAGGEAPPTIQLIDASGSVIGQADAGANGAYTVMLNVPVMPNAVNTYTVRARAVDLAGNTGNPSLGYTLTIDTRVPTPPGLPTLSLSPLDDSGIAGDNTTNIRQPNLVGQTRMPGQPAPPGQTLRVDLLLLGGPSPATLVSGVGTAADGSFQVRLPNALPDGLYQLQARAFDLAGNESFSPVLTLVIDATAPATGPGLAVAAGSDTGVKGDARTSARRPVLVGSVGANVAPGTRVEIIDPRGDVLNQPAATVIQPDGSFATQLASDLVNGSIALQVRLRDAAGNPGTPGPALGLSIVTTAGDYDADGRADLAVFRRLGAAPSQWSIGRSFLGPRVQAFGGGTDIPLQADFDGDGVEDLAVFRFDSATWFILGSQGMQFGPGGQSLPVPADYDGDGRADLAVYVPGVGAGLSSWFVRGSRDGVTRGTPFGAAGYQPVPADYDGDGRADLAVYRPAAPGAPAQWSIMGSAGGFGQLDFGGPGHVPVPADYDGDGRVDLAVYQAAPGPADSSVWFVLGSRAGFSQTPFGGSSHIPVPQDFDNDGRAEFATFDFNSAQWFIRFSTNGVTGSTRFGVAGDMPPAAPLLPYRLSVATAPAAVRSAAVAPAPPAAVLAVAAPTPTPTSTPEVRTRSLDFGQTAAQLASGARRVRAQGPARRRQVPAQAADRGPTGPATRRLGRHSPQDDAVATALEDRPGRIRVDRLVAHLR